MKTREKLNFSLGLLMQVPIDIILHSQKIMEVLSNNFSSNQTDSSKRDEFFYDEVVKNLPDSIIITDSNFNVFSMNNSTFQLFGKNVQINSNIKDFFKSESFINNLLIDDIHSFDVDNKEITWKNSDNSLLYLSLSIVKSFKNYIIIFKNKTQNFIYNQLINEEKIKSDKMLATILPTSLIQRVQSGEKNIGFSVQSATIVFIDIVNFTPWCSSTSIEKVMLTLNTLFRNFDNIINKKSTMTKVKCIGDCYMAAGGIFTEINNPTLHAKESVDFGLEAIEIVKKINIELNLDLKIRVGINTGGPVNAGVIGTMKPAFEILGPSINMAQQMEHEGVPMFVHSTRSVIELIYGSDYEIQERGEIIVKGKNIITYLISKK